MPAVVTPSDPENMLYTIALLAALQQPQGTAPTATAPASPVARLAITPTQRTVQAGDSIRLSARALDAEGQEVRNARIVFQQVGAGFEAEVDQSGLVVSGSTGVLPISVIAIVPGVRPFAERIEIEMIPGPATRVDISPRPERLVAGQRVRLAAAAFSALDDRRQDRIQWRSSAPAIARVSEDGLVTAVAPGRATITATAGSASQSHTVQVVAANITSIELTPSATSARQGDVIRLSMRVRGAGGAEITGLSPTWSFSPGHGMIEQDGTFVGYEPGEYVITASLGTRSADAVVRLEPRGVRRPLEVVGRLPRTLFSTEEVWIHPNGEVAYLGTGRGGDRMYALDITDPSNPVVTDSLMANTRRVNDVMTTPDGRYLVHTREGAADRRNGIVIASLEDPRHPKKIAEFTEGVTAGVHSAFVYRQERYGTHVYATNNGTGALHIIDISDPHNPREAATWRTEGRPEAGRTLHDVDVQDGLAYLSYWNDGLVVLDVGNGVRGGSPSNPQFVMQYKYDLNDLYRHVEAVGGPGFIRGTHTSWRHKDYVFIADEVFPGRAQRGTRDASASRAFGRLQVIDVSDWDNPRSIAWFEPQDGGVHNVWIAGDTLYMGAYNAGFRVFDISGELRGDLYAQGREIGHLNTADTQGNVANAAMTWGVVVRDGLAYVNDMNNGLWVVRIEPEPARRLTP